MDSNLLTASTGTGTQTTTQNPQIAGKSTASGARSSSVQPGTTPALLNNSGGVPLSQTPLTTVNLNGSTATTASVATAKTVTTKHQINPVMTGLVALLFVIAIVSFWMINRSAKNTT